MGWSARIHGMGGQVLCTRPGSGGCPAPCGAPESPPRNTLSPCAADDLSGFRDEMLTALGRPGVHDARLH